MSLRNESIDDRVAFASDLWPRCFVLRRCNDVNDGDVFMESSPVVLFVLILFSVYATCGGVDK